MAQTADAKSVPLRRKREDGDENADVGGKMGKKEPSRIESCLDQPMDSGSVHEVVKFVSSPLPARHYDADTTEPVSCALQTLEQLLSWKLSESNPFNVAVVPLAPRETPLTSCPRRTLVSHDMMGGYLDDRFVQGTSSDAPYVFYHWQYIDIFNYFSHNLVTIPPAVWTNAAHRHGVSVIGTFITEWTEGAVSCESFLKDEESYREAADKLVQISCCYGFDGWLINIENTLSEAAVKNTPLFLRYLTDQMHTRVPGSLVLWYDSVVENGQLKWQNELNQSNRMFFDACDGFFTNYNWTEQNLESMRDYSEIQGRHADVYVGVDVFGRGKVVGGMFETNKALEVIRRHNFSAAVFAPGWVYETHKAEFRKNQDKFWALLSDHLFIHRAVTPLPFVSSFCQGFGKALYWRGQAEWSSSWFNLTAQDVQPLYHRAELGTRGWLRSRGCSEDAWSGGSALLLDGLLPAAAAAAASPACAKFLSIHVPLPANTLVVLIYKPSAGITVSLELKTTDADVCSLKDVQDDELKRVSPEVLNDRHQLVKQFSQLSGSLNGWTVGFWQVEQPGCALREVNVRIQQNEEDQDTSFTCRVGELMLLDASTLQDPPEAVQGFCVYDVVWLHGAGSSPESSGFKLHLNATLRWEYPCELVRHFKVYSRQLRGPDPRVPPGQLVLVGRAYSNLFRVTELKVERPPGLLELVVEPVVKKGLPVPESHWGRRSVSYTTDTTA